MNFVELLKKLFAKDPHFEPKRPHFEWRMAKHDDGSPVIVGYVHGRRGPVGIKRAILVDNSRYPGHVLREIRKDHR